MIAHIKPYHRDHLEMVEAALEVLIGGASRADAARRYDIHASYLDAWIEDGTPAAALIAVRAALAALPAEGDR